MARPKKFESEMISKSILLTKEEIEKAIRLGGGEFSEGVRKCIQFFDESFTEEYASAETDRLKSLINCNEQTHNKLVKDLARFEKHKYDAVKALSTMDDNKLDFLKKCKRSYLDVKTRVPDNVGFTFKGWLRGPANTVTIKELWKDERTAFNEIANYLKDRSWINEESEQK